jgi:hypothetical protein
MSIKKETARAVAEVDRILDRHFAASIKRKFRKRKSEIRKAMQEVAQLPPVPPAALLEPPLRRRKSRQDR